MVTSTSGPGGTPTTSVPNNLHGHHAASSAGGHHAVGGTGGSSTCGSDEDFKIFESSCELHGGDPYRGYPPTFECPEIYRALDGVRYIAECTMREEESSKVLNPTGSNVYFERLRPKGGSFLPYPPFMITFKRNLLLISLI